MALIKCSECGKEFSSKATCCPNCGYYPSYKDKNPNKKSHVSLVIIIVLALALLIVLGILIFGNKKNGDNKTNNINNDNNTSNKSDKQTKISGPLVIDLYYGEGCIHCDEFMDFYESLDDSVKSKIKLNKYEVWNNETNNTKMKTAARKLGTEAEGVPFIVFNKEKYIDGFADSVKNKVMNIINSYISNYDGNITDDNVESGISDNPQIQKLINYLNTLGWTCDDDTCYYSYTKDGKTNNYRLELSDKLYIMENDDSESSWYIEYDYENSKGYLKYINKVGILIETETWYTYNSSDNTYNYECTSDLDSYCSTRGDSLAKMIDLLHTEILNYCNSAGVDINDL